MDIFSTSVGVFQQGSVKVYAIVPRLGTSDEPRPKKHALRGLGRKDSLFAAVSRRNDRVEDVGSGEVVSSVTCAD
jgi:hypothetical protein